MPIKISVEVTTPITAEDRDLLGGLTLMAVALSNHETPTEPAAPEPALCGSMEYEPDGNGYMNATGKTCVNEVGHKGRHRYRAPETEELLVPVAPAPEGRHN